jgi:Na+-transporting NADH:ubiquinone oxidoreductase subunit C
MSNPKPAEVPSPRRESVVRTLLVALIVSLVCSSLVASASVLLKPRQVANARVEMRRNILGVADVPGGDMQERFQRIEPRVVDLESGDYVPGVDPTRFDPLQAARDPDTSTAIPPAIDIARLGRRPNRALVYLVHRDGQVHRIILPVWGHGLWSMLYGFVALEPDARTIADVTFYSHGETPGLGDFITKPSWRALWRGKRIFDDSGNVAIRVVKGHVSANNPRAEFLVDGVSGATLTGNGVTNLMQYWLGEHGYGPYLRKLRGGQEP